MSALQTFLLVVDNNKQEAKQIAEQIAQDVENKRITLFEVVQSLGEYINDEDPIIRGKAVSYLTAVIRELPSKSLSRQQVQVLTAFFCDRIEDGGAVAGLETLQSSERFSKALAETVARAIFDNFKELQSRSQSQRFQVYQLLNELMSNHRVAMRDMGDDSLIGTVELMTGEKDPRNLMLVFSILKVIMVEWDISNHAERLFDSVYNYFPITFRPPPNDPYGISAQDLKDRLQDCISSSRHFAPYSIPALLEKLDSTGPNVKKDTINALIACIRSYDPNTVSRYSITMWNVLKFEVFNAQEEILADLSLLALRCICERLSEGVTEVSEELPLAKFLSPVTKDCNEHVRETQHKQTKPAQRILSATSAASAVSFTLVSRPVIEPILNVYHDAGGMAKQRGLLETLVVLFDSAAVVFGEWASDPTENTFQNSLLQFKDQFSEIFSQALMNVPTDEVFLRIAALKGLLRLSTIRDFFQENEIGLFMQYLNEILLKEEIFDQGDIQREAITALAEISKQKPQLIINMTLPAFIATLPDSGDGANQDYLKTLENLAQISTQRDIFETLVHQLLGKLAVLLQKEESGSVAYPRAIFTTILYVMKQRKMDEDPSLEFYYNSLVIGLCRSIAAAASGKASNRILNDPTVLDTIGQLCNLIVRSLPRDKQEEAVRNVYTLFAQADDFTPIPFAQSPSEDQRRTMIISTYLLAGLPKDDINLPYVSTTMSALLSDMIQRCISETDLAAQFAFLRHVALLVNKFLDKSDLDIATGLFDNLLPPGETDRMSSVGVIKTVFWLSKALILRLAPRTSYILSSLLSLLSSSNEQTSVTAARGFSILLSSDHILSEENSANIRLLCKQRVFATVTPLISTRIREVSTVPSDGSTAAVPAHIKPAHLTALSGIISSIPSSLVMPHLPTLLPLLLQSLDLQTSSSVPVRIATLETLAVIIRENGVKVIDETGHVQSLVTRLLNTASSSSFSSSSSFTSPSHSTKVDNPARLRIDALKCLYLLAQSSALQELKTSSPLLPVKGQVMRSLRMVLDDPKRDVRKAAVDARGEWLRTVDDTGDDD